MRDFKYLLSGRRSKALRINEKTVYLTQPEFEKASRKD